MEPLLHQFSCAGVLSRRAARRDWLKAEINRLLTSTLGLMVGRRVVPLSRWISSRSSWISAAYFWIKLTSNKTSGDWSWAGISMPATRSGWRES